MLAKCNLLLIALCTVAACSESDICTLEPRPGIVVEIRDSVTNAGIAQGSSAVAQEGAYLDSVVVSHALLATLASNRGGTYEVRVRKSGYIVWTRSGVSVPGGQCGPDDPVQLIARLRASS